MVNVKDKLEARAYENKMPYPHGNVRLNRIGHEAFRVENRRLEAEFKADALEYVGLTNHRLAEKVWDKAWSDGHAYGYREVLNELEALADIVLG